MRKQIGNALIWIFTIVSVWFGCDILFRWFENPELTQMQLFLAQWERYAITAGGAALMSFGYWLEKR